MANNTWYFEGKQVPISTLESNHILNIIKMIENKAINGVRRTLLIAGYESDSVVQDPDLLDTTQSGIDLIQSNYPSYLTLVKEAHDRQLITDDEMILKITTCLKCGKFLNSKYKTKKCKCINTIYHEPLQ